ncbi:MAG: bacterial Ig-like domain-containing protein [Coriobacteriales bacterium]|nr:bacterial Ig-like domain-containing protein [Coriobacteriales bacterium]
MKKKFLSIFMSFVLVASFSGLLNANIALADDSAEQKDSFLSNNTVTIDSPNPDIISSGGPTSVTFSGGHDDPFSSGDRHGWLYVYSGNNPHDSTKQVAKLILISNNFTSNHWSITENLNISAAGSYNICLEAYFHEFQTEPSVSTLLNGLTVTPPGPFLTGISLLTLPNKTQYFIGEDFDKTGLAVKKEYSDGSSITYIPDDDEILGFDSDTAGQKTITVIVESATTDFIVSVLEDYKMIEGANLIYEFKDMVFRSEAPFEKFSCVKIDDEILSDANYTATEGSTVVTVKASYLDTLAAGEHTIDIVSTDGYAETNFTIPDKEVAGATDTGDSAPYAPLGLAVLTLSIAGAVVVLRKRFN